MRGLSRFTVSFLLFSLMYVHVTHSLYLSSFSYGRLLHTIGQVHEWRIFNSVQHSVDCSQITDSEYHLFHLIYMDLSRICVRFLFQFFFFFISTYATDAFFFFMYFKLVHVMDTSCSNNRKHNQANYYFYLAVIYFMFFSSSFGCVVVFAYFELIAEQICILCWSLPIYLYLFCLFFGYRQQQKSKKKTI